MEAGEGWSEEGGRRGGGGERLIFRQSLGTLWGSYVPI